jgi:hypothetical protein
MNSKNNPWYCLPSEAKLVYTLQCCQLAEGWAAFLKMGRVKIVIGRTNSVAEIETDFTRKGQGQNFETILLLLLFAYE